MDKSIRRNVCLELLVAGQVEAFSELYAISEDTPALSENEDLLRSFQKQLSAAETADRSGNKSACFSARKSLAELSQRSGLAGISKHFWDSCFKYMADSPQQQAETHCAMAEKLFNEGESLRRLFSVSSHCQPDQIWLFSHSL